MEIAEKIHVLNTNMPPVSLDHLNIDLNTSIQTDSFKVANSGMLAMKWVFESGEDVRIERILKNVKAGESFRFIVRSKDIYKDKAELVASLNNIVVLNLSFATKLT